MTETTAVYHTINQNWTVDMVLPNSTTVSTLVHISSQSDHSTACALSRCFEFPQNCTSCHCI